MWSNQDSEDADAVELVLSDVGNKWRTSRPGTVEVRCDERNWRAGSLDSVVGIANRYGLEGTGIESRWGLRFSAPLQIVSETTQPPVQRLPGLSWGYRGPGRGVGHPHFLAPRLKKEYSYTSTPPMCLRGVF